MKGQASRELLIEEVKKYPVLYNTQHENHKDIETRDKCWLQISQRLGENSEVLKREWKILRDSLRQVVKKRGRIRKSGAPVRKWRFESKMAFLVPFMTERGPGAKRPASAARAADLSDAELDAVDAVELDKPEYWDSGTSAAEVDALELFFSSVCQSTKKLPKKFQNRVKRQILDVVMKAEEEHEAEAQHVDTKANVFGAL